MRLFVISCIILFIIFYFHHLYYFFNLIFTLFSPGDAAAEFDDQEEILDENIKRKNTVRFMDEEEDTETSDLTTIQVRHQWKFDYD